MTLCDLRGQFSYFKPVMGCQWKRCSLNMLHISLAKPFENSLSFPVQCFITFETLQGRLKLKVPVDVQWLAIAGFLV